MLPRLPAARPALSRLLLRICSLPLPAGLGATVRPAHANDPTTVAALKRVEAKSRAVAARSRAGNRGHHQPVAGRQWPDG